MRFLFTAQPTLLKSFILTVVTLFELMVINNWFVIMVSTFGLFKMWGSYFILANTIVHYHICQHVHTQTIDLMCCNIQSIVQVCHLVHKHVLVNVCHTYSSKTHDPIQYKEFNSEKLWMVLTQHKTLIWVHPVKPPTFTPSSYLKLKQDIYGLGLSPGSCFILTFLLQKHFCCHECYSMYS